jgi:hypothetical protein
MLSRYYDKTAIEAEVAAGRHRESVGGLWDEIGELQADFLMSRGLRPHHRLLDIGCGRAKANPFAIIDPCAVARRTAAAPAPLGGGATFLC